LHGRTCPAQGPSATAVTSGLALDHRGTRKSHKRVGTKARAKEMRARWVPRSCAHDAGIVLCAAVFYPVSIGKS
jgi:pyrrolidone-carboxylate peptidase